MPHATLTSGYPLPTPLAVLARIHNGKCLKHSLKNGSGIAMAFSSARERKPRCILRFSSDGCPLGAGSKRGRETKAWAWADDCVSLSLLNQLGPLRAGSDVTHFEDLP